MVSEKPERPSGSDPDGLFEPSDVCSCVYVGCRRSRRAGAVSAIWTSAWMAFTWDFRKRHAYPPRAHGRAAPAEAGARARIVRVIVEVVPFRSLVLRVVRS